MIHSSRIFQGENQWSFPPTVLDHEKSEDLELGRALKLLDIHVENVLGPDGMYACLLCVCMYVCVSVCRMWSQYC